jgi:chitin deacetylase
MTRRKTEIFKALRVDVFLIIFLVSLIGLVGYSIVTSHTFQFFGGLVHHVSTREKVIALTFDDGPREKHLSEIHAPLEKYNAEATFFLIGKEINAHPAAMKRLVDGGYEIGNHSYDHRSLLFLGPGVLESEITLTDKAIRASGYTGTIPFRPPYGHKFISLPLYMKLHNRQTIMWSIAPDDDPRHRTAKQMADNIEKEVKPGSIIILHVMEDHRAEQRKSLEMFIPALHKQG